MEIEYDDDPRRIQRDVVRAWLRSEAYWGTWRRDADIDACIDGSWRVVGAYRADTGALVGFARAVSDGVSFAYLADVYLLAEHQGRGLGKRLLRAMIDDGPGRDFRWTLFTADAHGLYEQFGFTDPGPTALVRPAAQLPVHPSQVPTA